MHVPCRGPQRSNPHGAFKLMWQYPGTLHFSLLLGKAKKIFYSLLCDIYGLSRTFGKWILTTLWGSHDLPSKQHSRLALPVKRHPPLEAFSFSYEYRRLRYLNVTPMPCLLIRIQVISQVRVLIRVLRDYRVNEQHTRLSDIGFHRCMVWWKVSSLSLTYNFSLWCHTSEI